MVAGQRFDLPFPFLQEHAIERIGLPKSNSPIPREALLRSKGIVELRPFVSRVLLAMRHADFHAAAAAATLIIRDREVHLVHPAVAGPGPLGTEQDLVAGDSDVGSVSPLPCVISTTNAKTTFS